MSVMLLMNDERFAFGKNWKAFLAVLGQRQIDDAAESLRSMTGVQSLDGLRFLDLGCGSGLFSLAAHRLGAKVVSIDYDPDSVACTKELRRRYGSPPPPWEIRLGSQYPMIPIPYQ